MSARQSRFYNHRIDIYRPNDLVMERSGDIAPRTYSLIHSNVPCRREAKTVYTDSFFTGQTAKEYSAGRIDVLHLGLKFEIGPEYVVKFLTPGPDQNEFFICKGQPAIKDWKADKQSIFISRTLKPNVI